MPIKLSICISTFNRAAFIGETLESVISQLNYECELVVSDNASTDDTEAVVAKFAAKSERVRYVRHDTENGPDRNFDRAIGIALGEYCWLLSDDDPLKVGAISRVLKALESKPSVVIVNSEVRDVSLSHIHKARFIPIYEDKVYGPEKMDDLFLELLDQLVFSSSYIVKSTIWRERDRDRYYGSLFIFIGVVFQKPLPGDILVIAEPLINMRFGNSHSWFSQLFEISTVGWAQLIRSLGLSDSTKISVGTDSWLRPASLFLWRGMGVYGPREYERFIKPQPLAAWLKAAAYLIAVLPGSLVNTICVLSLRGSSRTIEILSLVQSPFHFSKWKVFSKASAR